MLDHAFYAACLLEHRELRFYITSRDEQSQIDELMHAMGKRFPKYYVVYEHGPTPGIHTIVLSDLHSDLMDIPVASEYEDMVVAVEHFVSLKPRGHEIAYGPCPFHGGSDATFAVTSGYWHCFAGCGEGGYGTFWDKVKGYGLRWQD